MPLATIFSPRIHSDYLVIIWALICLHSIFGPVIWHVHQRPHWQTIKFNFFFRRFIYIPTVSDQIKIYSWQTLRFFTPYLLFFHCIMLVLFFCPPSSIICFVWPMIIEACRLLSMEYTSTNLSFNKNDPKKKKNHLKFLLSQMLSEIFLNST